MADPTKTTRTPAIMVPVPNLSRERRSALAFASHGGGVPLGERALPIDPAELDPAELEPVKMATARALLLEVATKAIERALEGAVDQYQRAMYQKYSAGAVREEAVEESALVESEDAEGNPEGDESVPRHGFFSR